MNRDRYEGASEVLAKIREFCHTKADEEREASSSYAVIGAYENVMYYALELSCDGLQEWDLGVNDIIPDQQ